MAQIVKDLNAIREFFGRTWPGPKYEFQLPSVPNATALSTLTTELDAKGVKLAQDSADKSKLIATITI